MAWGILGADWASPMRGMTMPVRRRAALVRAVTADRALPEGARRCSEAQLDSLLQSSDGYYATEVRATNLLTFLGTLLTYVIIMGVAWRHTLLMHVYAY